jgi:mono/diheme cytochrome c family protein
MNISYKAWRVVGTAGLALLASTTASAAENTLGKSEYVARCAMCHGPGGKGDGWLADNLLKRPPSLTELKKKNGGVFPLASVIEVIDGRKAVSLHGPREMPVWGTVYRVEEKAANAARPATLTPDEQLALSKIRALANYVLQLQE